MKTLNVKNMSRTRQAGFTIIELVVVILLLGILTATALPRFLDVTDEAHDAVVDAVRGGMGTGAALFRAQFVAEGQQTGLATGYGSGLLFPDSDTGTGSGYPAGEADGAIDDGADCLAIYQGLVQVGRPVAVAADFSATPATLETNIEAGAGTAVDFVITADTVDAPGGSPTGCILHYVGQFKSGNTTASADIPRLTYTLATGAVVEAADLTLNLID